MEEQVVVGLNGGCQIVVKSGAKPKLDNITLSQRAVANLSILYGLVNDGKLAGHGLSSIIHD